MPVDQSPFDTLHVATPQAQAGLISEALASGDSTFVWAALRASLRAQELAVDVLLPDDPRLSVVLAAIERLGMALVAVVKTP